MRRRVGLVVVVSIGDSVDRALAGILDGEGRVVAVGGVFPIPSVRGRGEVANGGREDGDVFALAG